MGKFPSPFGDYEWFMQTGVNKIPLRIMLKNPGLHLAVKSLLERVIGLANKTINQG